MGQPGQFVATAETTAAQIDDAAGMSLVFRAGSLLCALRLDEVIETMRPLPIQPLAGTPPFVAGVTIMRGGVAPVVDVAQLLGGRAATVSRFVAVRTPRGPVALATSTVLGIRSTGAVTAPDPLLGAVPHRLVAAVGTIDAEPVFVLQSMRLVTDEVWAATAALAGPS